MLPPSAVNEVAALPNELASNLHALEFDLASHFTGLGYLRDAHLHAQFVHRKINSNLPKLAAGIEQEVDRAIEELLDAPTDGWREVTIYPILTELSSRVSARIMLGKDYATDKKWLGIAQKFTENCKPYFLLVLFLIHADLVHFFSPRHCDDNAIFPEHHAAHFEVGSSHVVGHD